MRVLRHSSIIILALAARVAFAGWDGYPFYGNSNAVTWPQMQDSYQPFAQIAYSIEEKSLACGETSFMFPDSRYFFLHDVQEWPTYHGTWQGYWTNNSSSNSVFFTEETRLIGTNTVTNGWWDLITPFYVDEGGGLESPIYYTNTITTNCFTNFVYTYLNFYPTNSHTYLRFSSLEAIDAALFNMTPYFVATNVNGADLDTYMATAVGDAAWATNYPLDFPMLCPAAVGLYAGVGVVGTNITSNKWGHITGGDFAFSNQPCYYITAAYIDERITYLNALQWTVKDADWEVQYGNALGVWNETNTWNWAGRKKDDFPAYPETYDTWNNTFDTEVDFFTEIDEATGEVLVWHVGSEYPKTDPDWWEGTAEDGAPIFYSLGTNYVLSTDLQFQNLQPAFQWAWAGKITWQQDGFYFATKDALEVWETGVGSQLGRALGYATAQNGWIMSYYVASNASHDISYVPDFWVVEEQIDMDSGNLDVFTRTEWPYRYVSLPWHVHENGGGEWVGPAPTNSAHPYVIQGNDTEAAKDMMRKFGGNRTETMWATGWEANYEMQPVWVYHDFWTGDTNYHAPWHESIGDSPESYDEWAVYPAYWHTATSNDQYYLEWYEVGSQTNVLVGYTWSGQDTSHYDMDESVGPYRRVALGKIVYKWVFDKK